MEEFEKLSKAAQNLINLLYEQDGSDLHSIRLFLEDGAAMKEYGLTDDDIDLIEEVWQFAKDHENDEDLNEF